MFRSKFSGKTLWNDMMAINLFSQVKSLKVPVYFFLGKYDHIVSSKLASEYFNVLDAKVGKQLIWFNESAHRPQTEEPKKFVKELVKVKESLLDSCRVEQKNQPF
jgi:pimeloyl-ACP methyl ester carboxylesterase